MIKNKELYERALLLKGIESQIDITVEEMSEATHALLKYKRLKENIITKDEAIDKIYNELADVQIMIEQMLISFDIEKKFDECKQYKLERLRKRLEILENSYKQNLEVQNENC